jgi:alpha-ketoglutarate-dependent taurine dioxygenase
MCVPALHIGQLIKYDRVFCLPEIVLDESDCLSLADRAAWLDALSAVFEHPAIDLLYGARERLYRTDYTSGYALLRGIEGHRLTDDELKRLNFAISCFFGQPIKVFIRRGIWHDVPVNLNAHPERYSGIGYNPFHIDVMNAIKPPELVVFFCARNDPQQGGRTLLSNILAAFDELPGEERTFLSSERFNEGVFYGIQNTDGPCDPYPVVEYQNNGRPLFRYTARGITKQDSEKKAKALVSLDESLKRRAFHIDLLPGDLLILNQRLIAHAREPLGPNQDKLNVDSRRLLHRLFMNYSDLT